MQILRKKGMIRLPYKDRERDEIEIIVDRSWSAYCNLDYWIGDMDRGTARNEIPKHVLKMAMKHLRDELETIHTLAAQLQEDKENANS